MLTSSKLGISFLQRLMSGSHICLIQEWRAWKSATSIIFMMYLTYGMILAFSQNWTSKSRNIFFPFFIPYLNPTLTKVHLMLIHLELNLKLNLSNNICLRMFFFIKPLVNGSPRSVDLRPLKSTHFVARGPTTEWSLVLSPGLKDAFEKGKSHLLLLKVKWRVKRSNVFD